MLEKNPQLSSLAAGQRPGMPHAPLFPIKLCHVGSYHLQHHQRDAAGLRWGEIPSKPSLKQRAEQKVDSSRGKGISEQRVSQSQPPLPHSSIILAPKRAHTHTRAAPSPLRTETRARRGTACFGGCVVLIPSAAAHGGVSVHGDSSPQGVGWHPPCFGDQSSP